MPADAIRCFSIAKNCQIFDKNKHTITGLPGDFLHNAMRAHRSNQFIDSLVADVAYFLDGFNAGGGLHEQGIEQALCACGSAPELEL